MSISVFCNNLEEIKMFLHKLSSNYLDEEIMHLSDQELENEVVFSEQLDDEDKSLKDVEDLEEDENDNK